MSSIRVRSFPSILFFILAGVCALVLTGCTLDTTSLDAPIPGAAFHGVVFGANQPVVGSHVYLMAATVSGIGSAGYGLASTSLLSAAQTGHSDTVGAYVLTNSLGAFNITGDYTCPTASTQVYMYEVGGNPGAGTNNAASMMAALGSCGNLTSSTFVYISELTTVAAAYSLAGFATDALHVSIPQYSVGVTADTLAQTGLQNAFANVNNLVNGLNGAALSTTPGGNGTPVAAQVITLGNLLAACVNSNGATTNPSNCYTLFNNAGSTGGATGTIPTETATAAINIAHRPYFSAAAMTNLYGLQPATGAPFPNGDSAQPTDFTVAINFTGGGLNRPYSIAIDVFGNPWTANYFGSSLSKFSSSGTVLSGSGYTGGGISSPNGIAFDSVGNAWTANYNGNSISKFSSTGTALSGSGYTGAGLNGPDGIAIDVSGNAWVSNYGGSSISKFSSSGTALSGSGYTGGGLGNPYAIAFDVTGNAWLENYGPPPTAPSVSKFSSSGAPLSGSGYIGSGLSNPQGIAIDSAGNLWTSNYGNSSLSEFSNSGTALSGSGYTGGGLNGPDGIAFDGSGNVWVANYSANTVSKFSSSGAAISPGTGYTGGGLNQPYSIAIDGSGNIWVANFNSNSITELVGAAMPVVTPIVANLIAPYTTPASKP